ncbi:MULTISPECIES: hypothetical protein [Pseudomonas syringae group]|nr:MULTISPECIES: hypothetical protein [Pseudomonas syringae group]
MRLTLTCMQCLRENGRPGGASKIEVRDDGCYTAVCLAGHKTLTILQQHKFEVLFEIGANAILDGYHREAVSSFTSSLERFYEYAIRILLEKNDLSDGLFQTVWKSVSNMSERQLGAFIFLWANHFKENPLLLPASLITFRNEVIHKGKIPSQEEALKYGNAVLNVLRPKIKIINETLSEHVKNANFRTVAESAMKADASLKIQTMCIGVILNQDSNMESEGKSLEEHLILVDRTRIQFDNLQEYFNQMLSREGTIMSLGEIHDFLVRKFPELIAKKCKAPDGWSFFLGPIKQGQDSNCIVRALEHSDGGTQFELSVSSRLEGTKKTSIFSGSEEALRQVVDAQLRIYRDQL